MPTAPNIRIGGEVSRGGSVGRQSISAPTEAFGSGRALQQAGAGIQGIARDLKAREKKQEQLAAQNARTRKAALTAQEKAAADRAKILTKARNDRYKLSYNMSRQEDSLVLKGKLGVNGTAVLTQYDSMTKKRISDTLKDFDGTPLEKEQLITDMLESDLARRNTMITHQNAQTVATAKNDFAVNTESLTNKIGSNYTSMTMFGNDVNEWMKQFGPEIAKHALSSRAALGMSDAEINDNANSIIRDGSTIAINNMISDIGTSTTPDKGVDNVKDIVSQFPDKIFTKEQRADFIKDAEAQSKTVKKQAQERIDAATAKELSEFDDVLVNLKTDPDRENAFHEFARKKPGLKPKAQTIFNSYKGVTPQPVDEEWTNKLMQTTDPEQYNKELDEALQSGDIFQDAYQPLKKASSVKMSTLKTTEWDGIMSRLNQIKAGVLDIGGAGKGELPADIGTFGSDLEVDKELINGWKVLKDASLDPNVTHVELKQVADSIFFKPEARISSFNAEKRLAWGSQLLQQARALPGTQDLVRDKVAFKKSSQASKEEIWEEVKKRITVEQQMVDAAQHFTREKIIEDELREAREQFSD